ncbi:MAG TPA: VWA domain-containing protein [Chitinophagaceae bacterium]|nr:VWA domain-containing protein [Chitinophagaceae bacterium]
MEKIQAFQTNSLSEGIMAFARFARSHGMNIGIQETQDALQASAAGLLTNRSMFKNALKALFCTSPEEGRQFEKLFILFWDTNPLDLEERKNETKLEGSVTKKTNSSLVMLGVGKSEPSDEEASNVSGANSEERLKKVDLSLLNTMEADELEDIARRLCRQMAVRMRRRMKQHRRQGQINMRRTIRKSIASGGEPIDLFHRLNSPKKQRLIVLLDVSGSMDKYSFFLLRFICALREHFRQLEAFVFSTSLKRITHALDKQNLGTVLKDISEHADNWSSGTRIGECLQQFSETYGKRMLNGSPVVLILSDGLDTGDASLLGAELQKIHRRAKKVIWLNPLKGSKGYAPLAKGMKAALPSVDDFRSAHNLESLLELENILSNA